MFCASERLLVLLNQSHLVLTHRLIPEEPGEDKKASKDEVAQALLRTLIDKQRAKV